MLGNEESVIVAPHARGVDEVFSILQTSSEGLTSGEAKRRLSRFGENRLEDEKVSWVKLLLRQLQNAFIYVLLFAAILSIFLGEPTDFFVILAVVFLNTMVGFWQEFKAEKSIEALKKMTESKAEVIRDGQLQQIPSSQLVLGDLIQMREGDQITADIRLISDASLMLDESAMTGESIPVEKDSTLFLEEEAQVYDLKNMALSGTSVVRGEGKGIVVATAAQTYFGKIADTGRGEVRQAPLLQAIRQFTRWMLLVFGSFFSVLFLIGWLQGRALKELAYIIVACLVSAIPEGLPLVITLVIVIGALGLSRKKTYVRVLPSVEALGSTTVIASDKTGTITEGRLVVESWVTQDEALLKRIASLCNDGKDPLDVSLLRWVENSEEIRRAFPRKEWHPFDAKQRWMATIHEIDGEDVVYIKGAFEALQEMSHGADDRAYHELLDQGYRTLALGRAKREAHCTPGQWNVEIIGLIGFVDPPRKEAKDAVLKAKAAQIKVLMITGDHVKTAKLIASQVGIYQEGDLALSGTEMARMEEEELHQAIGKATVFARISPENKYQIIKVLQEKGEIVGVTGDGVNDVPALRIANIGIAMGSGTEAAKSASEMVITDSNLQVIVDAIQKGRVITDNIRKILYYLLSTSFQEIVLLALSILFFLPIPLSAIQILWINLVTDGAQDKFFAFIQEEGDVMQRKPMSPSKKFMDRTQIWRVSLFALILGGFLFGEYVYLSARYSVELTSTIIFTSTVMVQWANGIQAQKESEPFFRNLRRSFTINPLVFVGLGIGLVLQLSVVYLFPGPFRLIPLNMENWCFPILSFLVAFGFVEGRKWVESGLR